jgi:profilin
MIKACAGMESQPQRPRRIKEKMMGTDFYEDLIRLIAAGFTHAAIVGHDGERWANTEGFEPTSNEVKTLSRLPGDPSLAIIEGINVAGTKYMYIKSDGKFSFGKRGNMSCVLAKTTSAIVIGVYDSTVVSGYPFGKVEEVANRLLSMGH